MPRCEHTDIDIQFCAHCLGHKEQQPDRAEAAAGRPSFTARFAGRCAGCGEPFEKGTQIRLASPSGWIAECCAPA